MLCKLIKGFLLIMGLVLLQRTLVQFTLLARCILKAIVNLAILECGSESTSTSAIS